MMALLCAACGDPAKKSEAPRDEALFARGQASFERVCTTCHTIQARVNSTGPFLLNLEGRKAGTAPGFDYSDAMRAYGETWTAAALDRFLADPEAAVPGTKMVIDPLADPQERKAVIYYLFNQ